MAEPPKYWTERETLIDEHYQLIQKGFYVEPPSKNIDSNTVVENGSDFIHKSKLEEASLKYSLNDDVNSIIEPTTPKERMALWGRKKAQMFSRYAIQLHKKKQSMMIRFPKVIETPKEEKEWCLFCLGSELCSSIYNTNSGVLQESQAPVLSIVLHLEQKELKLLLKYHYQWFNIIGMVETLCKWIYVLLACLKKPVGDKYLKCLEKFYNDCRKKLQTCEESEKHRLYYISSILANYFCVTSYKVGPPLERFKPLV